MRHIKEIFNHKDLSFIDDEYDNFLHQLKEVRYKNDLEPILACFLSFYSGRYLSYLQNKTSSNYLELTFAYELIDAYLKSTLSDGYITLNELQYIRAELKEGLIE